jgi:hypothetical protein
MTRVLVQRSGARLMMISPVQRLKERGRVIHGEAVMDGIRVHQPDALDQVEVLVAGHPPRRRSVRPASFLIEEQRKFGGGDAGNMTHFTGKIRTCS